MAATDGQDWVLSAVPQLGAIAILLWFGHIRLKKAEERAEAAEADGRAIRDAFIREMVPAMTLQTERSKELLDGLHQVVTLVERVVTAQIERSK
jgi:hypothetical protein